MTFYPRKTQIGERGQSLVDSQVRNRLLWIYRPQPVSDIGIDGEIEVIDSQNNSTGTLVKVQVKTATEFPKNRPVKVPIDRKHLNYWQGLQVPVILVAVNLETESAYWLPIDSSMSVPVGQESFSFEVPLKNVITKENRNSLKAWLEAIPKGVVANLLYLANTECDDIPVDQIPIGTNDRTDQEKVASEVLDMVSRLGVLFDGLFSQTDTESLGRAEVKLCQKRLTAIKNHLNALSDESAAGTVNVSIEYDPEDNDYRVVAEGSISTGYDNDGGANWSDDLAGETRGKWRGSDPRELLRGKDSAVPVC